jgi:hypothetical protein
MVREANELSAETIPAKPNAPAKYVTIRELASIAGISASTLHRLRKKGLIHGLQPGGPRTRLVFRSDALEAATAPSESPPAARQDHDEQVQPRRGPRPKWCCRVG